MNAEIVKTWWADLSDRERIILRIGAVVVVFCLFFLVIWAPMANWRDDARADAQNAARSFSVVRAAAEKSPKPSESDRLRVDLKTPARSAVLNSSARVGFDLNSINQQSNGDIAVSAVEADPEMVLAWIAQLQRQYGMSVIKADLAREQSNRALVRVQLTVGRR